MADNRVIGGRLADDQRARFRQGSGFNQRPCAVVALYSYQLCLAEDIYFYAIISFLSLLVYHNILWWVHFVHIFPTVLTYPLCGQVELRAIQCAADYLLSCSIPQSNNVGIHRAV